MTEIGKNGLQSQIAKMLDSLGIVYIKSRTDKRATTQRGTPDFIFAIIGQTSTAWNKFSACAWEIKLPKKKLRPDQERMRDRMTKGPNAWRFAVITSLDDAIVELKAIGLIS